MTRFIFVRHGQSEFNITNQFAGQSDPPLSRLGLLQVERMAAWVVGEYNVDAIYSSDLTRAMQTAQAVADKLSMTVIPNERFREIFAGEWQEKTYTAIAERYPKAYDLWRNDTINARPDGGESVRELAGRVTDEVKHLAKCHDGQTVLVATHATPVRVLTTHFQTGDTESLRDMPWGSNASVTVVLTDGDTATVERVAYDEFLADQKSTIPSDII